MKNRSFALSTMAAMVRLLLVSFVLAWAAPASAILTANSQSRSEMPDEVEQQVSQQTATAISAVALLVKDIEEVDSLEVNFENLNIALTALVELIKTLENNLDTTSGATLALGEIALPNGAENNPNEVERSRQALTQAVTFITNNIDGQISDRALAQFLLREARQAQVALALAQVAAENRNADLMRLAVLRFERFTYAAVCYSVVWSLVPAS